MPLNRRQNFNRSPSSQHQIGKGLYYAVGVRLYFLLGMLAICFAVLVAWGIASVIEILFRVTIQEYPAIVFVPFGILMAAMGAAKAAWDKKRRMQEIYGKGGKPKTRKYDDLDPRGMTPEETPWKQ